MPTQRLDALDVLRGLALLWMSVYHFCYDLNQFGHLRLDFYHDAFWTWQRSAIVGLFLFCSGLGQASAVWTGQSWRRFWRRWMQLACCALLVSAGSYAVAPQSFIYFGVLHGIALMLIVARCSAHAGNGLWPLGAMAIAVPFMAADWIAGSGYAALFNAPALNWLGLISEKPVTDDYVPLLPWLGVMVWGLAAGSWLLRRRPSWLQWNAPRPMRPLALIGRWSLTVYMLHQPLMVGALTLYSIFALARSSS